MATRRQLTKDQAEREYYIAEALDARAEAKKFAQEERHLRFEADSFQRREAVMAQRALYFNEDVEEYGVSNALDTLRDLRAMGNEPITVYLNSPGGDAFTGIMFYDLLQDAMLDGIHVTTQVTGLAASMASVLSQAGNERLISPNSWFMVHEPATVAWGKLGDIKREAKMMERLHDQLCAILAERSTLSKADIKRRSQDKDWWMDATEALEYGFFDGFSR